MTFGKTVTAVLALVAVVAVGIFVGPRLLHRGVEAPAPATTSAAAPVSPATAEPSKTVARPSLPHAESTRRVPEVSPSTPELQQALKPLLSYGTKLDKAADGFKSGMQFAAVAFAAKNTSVPFVVLKHRVLNEKKSLAAAIHESKPELNANREATKAWDQARQELLAL
jgi:hypothetical protein